ncbi:Glycosyltransferase involved in cell wall bisynthesis [Carboxydocella sporoproducens DSM 16521]|uniref:Glycosyltransferase involved in cell wall bisynthesis n=2 Tax=Carboxydocella TaxID=178898 RepID=A0A1T4P115_9FIRM|nr:MULTISPECIES: glycosyltransferase family 4 protein [Carboxydocella]AVX19588.1 Glycosyltransferase involved in cell wall bisynthesis [Carboxydocella thermautotrophica]AVX30003.1 Glycosyltransferase involved in cell wall bisynthesis [Carboxydocella thermautotrophica]SJZ85244.1 Glycosyltransferase involved in cell wall bisynthesis [Carboxydocella sporoproducens DSM 16521]
MKILMQNRPDPFIIKGGETVQMLQTKKALERLGHIVDISTELEPNLESYDVVHLFNLTMVGYTYIQALNAKKWRKPVVLSTIYFNLDEFESKGRVGLLKLINNIFDLDTRERLKAIARSVLQPRSAKVYLRQAFTGYIKQQRELLKMVDVILPNSKLEQECIYKDFAPLKPYCHVVPNAAENIYSTGSAERFYEKYGIKNFVLCVARIDNRKNQLALIEALKDTGLTVVFVGGVSPKHRKYFNVFIDKIRNNKNFIYFDEMPAEELADLYKAAEVHVLPSWVETPGLSSLEAALAGCKIVSTNRGSAPEYFQEYAWYCDPTDIVSIRKSVLAAYAAERSLTLAQYIKEKFNWDRAAEETIKGYMAALKINKF